MLGSDLTVASNDERRRKTVEGSESLFDIVAAVTDEHRVYVVRIIRTKAPFC